MWKIFSRDSKPIDQGLLVEPQTSRELARALTQITSGTEYVQAVLRLMDADIAERTAKRAKLSNDLGNALGHQLIAVEPEVLEPISFRDSLIEAAKAMAAAPDQRTSRFTVATEADAKARFVAPPMGPATVFDAKPEVLNTKAEVKARLTQMGEALAVAAAKPDEKPKLNG